MRNCRLAPGMYTIDLQLDEYTTMVDKIESSVAMEVIPSDLYGTGRSLPVHSAVVFPEAEWQVWRLKRQRAEVSDPKKSSPAPPSLIRRIVGRIRRGLRSAMTPVERFMRTRALKSARWLLDTTACFLLGLTGTAGVSGRATTLSGNCFGLLKQALPCCDAILTVLKKG